MGTKIENLEAAEAQRRLAAQLEPRSESASGAVTAEDYERTISEQERLTNQYQTGHDAPKSKS